MKKIIIIGCPGSGKSHLSKSLKELTGFPLYHLDMIYHNEDGSHISREEFIQKLYEIFDNDTWIMDGNYQSTLELRITNSDTVILLDYPLEACLLGANQRVGIQSDNLPFFEEKLDKEFEQRIINFSNEKLPEIYDLLDKYKSDKEIIILKSREESDNFVRKLTI